MRKQQEHLLSSSETRGHLEDDTASKAESLEGYINHRPRRFALRFPGCESRSSAER